MKHIYGTIGYTILKNIKQKNFIIVFADMHDKLPTCNNKINIAEWFKSKLNTSKILLEEVPREGMELKELWSDSPHTQELKELFINNPTLIQAVDIRPYLIPFNWEVINDLEYNVNSKLSLREYLKDLDDFFCLKLEYLINNLPIYKKEKLKNIQLGKHYLKIKNKYKQLLIKYKILLDISIKNIFNNNITILIKINDLLDEIMEWFICSQIYLNNTTSIILHTGLAHSEKVIQCLLLYYNYIIENRYGINALNETDLEQLNGCVELPLIIDRQFGGNKKYN